MKNIIDLTKESTSSQRSEIKKFVEKNNLLTELNGRKKGDVIEFWGGYNGDIRYRAQITGFDKDGEIYLDWDSFWFPIKDDKKRNIVNLKNGLGMSTTKKKPSPAQLAARKKFVEMAKNGTLAKKRKASTKNKGLKSPARAAKTLATLEEAYKNAKTPTQRANLKLLIEQTKPGLKAPASKGLVTLCAKTVGVTGRRKKDGTQKKGYIATKGGSLVQKKKPSKK